MGNPPVLAYIWFARTHMQVRSAELRPANSNEHPKEPYLIPPQIKLTYLHNSGEGTLLLHIVYVTDFVRLFADVEQCHARIF